MSCENCQCQVLDQLVGELQREVGAINKFLDTKFHDDLYPGATCGHWYTMKEREDRQKQERLNQIHVLRMLGYTVIEPGKFSPLDNRGDIE